MVNNRGSVYFVIGLEHFGKAPSSRTESPPEIHFAPILALLKQVLQISLFSQLFDRLKVGPL